MAVWATSVRILKDTAHTSHPHTQHTQHTHHSTQQSPHPLRPQAHEAVWPDMLAALSKHGWTNYSLFLREDGLLIGYVETPDWEQALKGMESEEVNTRWQKAMAEYFEEDGLANMTVVEQVFYLK